MRVAALRDQLITEIDIADDAFPWSVARDALFDLEIFIDPSGTELTLPEGEHALYYKLLANDPDELIRRLLAE